MIFAATPRGLLDIPEASIPALYASISQIGGDQSFILPLIEAGRTTIDVVFLGEPSAAWPERHLRNTRRPVVVVLGDDPGGLLGQGGPSAWRCTSDASAWCRSVMVHASGGNGAHYLAAARAVLVVRRVLFVETTTRHAAAWVGAIGCPRTLAIMPRAGAHPVTQAMN